MLQIALTDVRDGRRFTPKVTFLSGSISSFTDQNWFELTDPIDVPAGQCYLWAEFGRRSGIQPQSKTNHRNNGDPEREKGVFR